MSDRFDHNNSLPGARSLEYDREIQLLRNMESVHLRKKAAFDELLRYTYNNIKEADQTDSEHKNP